MDETRTENAEHGDQSVVSTELPPRRARLLCVDDSVTLLAYLRGLLEESYDVELALDGLRALEIAHARPPDVVISDLNMPGMGGFDLLLQFRREPALRPVPFIVMTVDTQEQSATHCLAAGAHDFLVKPFGAQELCARVGAAVRSHAMYKELERKHALLRESEARTRAIVESAHDGILTVTPAGTLEALNPAALEIFGWSEAEARGRELTELLVAPQARAQVKSALESAGSEAFGRAAVVVQETAGVERGGREFPMELRLARCESPSSGPMLSVFVRDLTEAKQLQIELQHAQKLEAVGRLAAGVAHEINTPIQYIGDNTRFLEGAVKSLLELLEQQRRVLAEAPIARMKRLELEGAAARADVEFLVQEVPQTVTEMLDGLKRVATIVRALLEFAHPDQGEMAEADVNRILTATLEVARTEYKYVADLEVQLTPVPNVLCHSGDLSQVFLNLVVNAVHAVMDLARPEGKKGRITVGTRAEGGQVVVSIQDDGCGIPEAVRGRIFEPFFSTKEAGRGTGQGLAIVKRIVEKHRGGIDFETEVGRGTTFFVRLPVAEAGSKGSAA